ncbi:MAG: hypothetical protein ACPGJV_02750 [Bacteriovoracaceae bacterium]
MEEFENILMFTDNLVIKPETKITSDHIDAFYPSVNLKHPHSSKVFRSPEGEASSAVEFDFIYARNVSSILVKGSIWNGLGFSGSLTIKASNNNTDWENPLFTTTLTPNHQFGFGASIFPVKSYRYWRIEGSGSTYFELGNIFIGDKVYFEDVNFNLGWNKSIKDLSKTKKNDYGQTFSDKRNKIAQYSGKFDLLNISDAEKLEDVFAELGTTEPFWMILNHTNVIQTDFERHSGQFKLRSIPKKTNNHFQFYSMPISLDENV